MTCSDAHDDCNMNKSIALQRLQRLLTHSYKHKPHISLHRHSTNATQQPDNDILSIGDIQYTLPHYDTINRPDLVPLDNTDPVYNTQDNLHHLRWMLQKYQLQQDMYLIGPPSAAKRQLTYKFASIIRSEIEYLPITRDTTEADLKQRAEVYNGTLTYIDQTPVRCARYGRILVIEGIEKAERNVLPTLNNLLENREMLLDDGSFLMNYKTYDQLLQSGMTEQQLHEKKLIRVHPAFRVIAIGLPVPRFPGYTLDPPLRSRFQGRAVQSMSVNSKIDTYLTKYDNINRSLLTQLVSFHETLNILSNPSSNDTNTLQIKFPFFSDTALEHMIATLSLFNTDIQPFLLNELLVKRVYPYQLICDKQQILTIYNAMQRFNVKRITEQPQDEIVRFTGFVASKHPNVVCCQYSNKYSTNTLYFNRPNAHAKHTEKPFIVTEYYQHNIFGPIIQDLLLNKDICILGNKGIGKTAMIKYLAVELGYAQHNIYTLHLFKDMTSRDLLQRRTTDNKGNTIWVNSIIVDAALNGGLLILDNFHTLPSYMLHSIRTLIEDRDCVLYDGTRLIPQTTYNTMRTTHTYEQLQKLKIYPIHTNFRIVALAVPPQAKDSERGSVSAAQQNQWLIDETVSLLSFHYLTDIDKQTQYTILSNMFKSMDKQLLRSLIDFANPTTVDIHTIQLSLRQLIRLCAHYQHNPKSLAMNIHRSLLTTFMPHTIRTQVEQQINQFMQRHNLKQFTHTANSVEQPPVIQNDTLIIDNVKFPINQPTNPELVPSILFYNIPTHIAILRDMVNDFIINERHLLLIGNQGVGKNKLTDRLCELCRYEREYMQLHRDTTVQALTLSPTLVNGIVVYDDSPLVKAVQYGRVLVIDEADKAPLEVVSILKGLVEDGHMTLSDGRTIVRSMPQNVDTSKYIVIHPAFKLIVLANRPGYPFLGNDFFRECGDIFVCHVIDNPDKASEYKLLHSYAPSISDTLLHQLIDVFAELRLQVETGTFSYPYSTRELVAIVKHLEQYPQDGLLMALDNVLAFDSYDTQIMNNLIAIFNQYGIPLSLGKRGTARIKLAESEKLPEPKLVQTWKTVTNAQQIKSNTVSAHMDTVDTTVHTVTQQPINGRVFNIEMQGNQATEQHTLKRIDSFTEEKLSFQAISNTRFSSIVSVVSFHGNICVLLSNPASLRVFTHESQYTKFHSIELDTFFPMYEIQGTDLHMFVTTTYIGIYAVSVGIVLCIEVPLKSKDVQTEFGTVGQHGQVTVTCSVLPIGQNKGSLSANFLQYLAPNFKSPVFRSYGTLRRNNDTSPAIKFIDTYVTTHSILYCYTVQSHTLYVLKLNNTSNRGVDVTAKQQVNVGLLVTIPLDTSVVISNVYTIAHNRLIVESSNMKRYHVTVNIDTLQYQVTDIDASHTVVESYQRTYALLNDMLKVSSTQYEKQLKLASHATGPALPRELSRNRPAIDGGMILDTDHKLNDGDNGINSVLLPYNAEQNSVAHYSQNQLNEILLYEIHTAEKDNRKVEFKHNITTFLKHTAQLALIATISYIDAMNTTPANNALKPGAYIAIVNFNDRTVRYLPYEIDDSNTVTQHNIPIEHITRTLGPLQSYRPYGEYPSTKPTVYKPNILYMFELSATELCVLFVDNSIRVYEIDPIQLQSSVSNWRKLFGEITVDTQIHMNVNRDKQTRDLTTPKHGKVDEKNEQHVGGNTWRGGSGGSDTAGMGGRGGPYRVDSGHQVHQISDEQKKDVSDEIREQAKKIAAEELAKRLKEIDMSIDEDTMYVQYYSKVEKQVAQLRTVLQATQSKQIERQWLSNQNQGDLDDNKLIDAVTGNKLVYRRRGTALPMDGAAQKLPKKLLFVMDVSGSMYRFNSTDQRLQRLLETCLLIMESFIGLEHKYDYSILGHSGDSPNISFTSFGSPPQNRKQRFQVLQRMYSHTQYCSSGDNTLEAIQYAINDMKQRESDESFVFVVSDANLRRYAIEPKDIATALTSNKSINSYIVFIASSGDEAIQTLKVLPQGKAYFTQNTHELPQIFQQIFQSTSVLQDT